jgi:hypothetical protein
MTDFDKSLEINTVTNSHRKEARQIVSTYRYGHRKEDIFRSKQKSQIVIHMDIGIEKDFSHSKSRPSEGQTFLRALLLLT